MVANPGCRWQPVAPLPYHGRCMVETAAQSNASAPEALLRRRHALPPPWRWARSGDPPDGRATRTNPNPSAVGRTCARPPFGALAPRLLDRPALAR